MSSDDVIAISGLVKDYGFGVRRKRALAGVDLRVPRGAAFGLVGPNGAGKTTLLKALLGVVHPTQGTIEVLGGSPSDIAVRARIGYLPERLALPEASTAESYLGSIGRLKRVATFAADVPRLLDRVGLASEAGARIRTFSKGMRQRLALAAALLGSPALLVLDEPTDGIDPKGRADVRAILQRELERGATVLFNTHLLSEAERFCNHGGILIRGRVARSGTMQSLRGDGDLEAALLAEMERESA